MMIIQAISTPVTRRVQPVNDSGDGHVIKNTPVAPRLPLNTLSDIQPHSSVPGIPAYSYRK